MIEPPALNRDHPVGAPAARAMTVSAGLAAWVISGEVFALTLQPCGRWPRQLQCWRWPNRP